MNWIFKKCLIVHLFYYRVHLIAIDQGINGEIDKKNRIY